MALTDAADATGAADGATSPSSTSHTYAPAAPTTPSTPDAGTIATAGAAAPTAVPLTPVVLAGPQAATLPGAFPAGVAGVERAQAARAAAPPPAHAGPSLHDLERAEAILKQLRARFQTGEREIRLELQPRELGRIAVKLELDGGVLRASLQADRPETLAVLEAHAPELRAWLAEDGVEVSELEFSLAGEGGAPDLFASHDGDREPAQERRSRAARSAEPAAADSPAPHTTSAAPAGVDFLV